MAENTKLNSKLLIQIQKPGVQWHTLIDNFKTLRFSIVKWSFREKIEHLKYILSE
jgi:hypothetical protein